MIENFTILTKGGLVLWTYELYPLRGSPINSLINNVLLADRTSEKQYNAREYTLKWTLDNHHGLVFVVCWLHFSFWSVCLLFKLFQLNESID